MEIRRAEQKDIPRIDALLRQVGAVHADGRPDLFKRGRKYLPEDLAVLLKDETRPVFVALDEAGCVIAHLFCRIEETPEDSVHRACRTLYIDDLCVDETARRRHAAQALYEFTRAWAKENAFHNITLFVWDFNAPAKQFYEAMGMQPQKICMEEILEEER